MFSKPWAFGLLAAGCLAAAGIGGYIAATEFAGGRDDVAPAASPAAASDPVPRTAATRGVTETGTVVDEVPASPVEGPASALRPTQDRPEPARTASAVERTDMRSDKAAAKAPAITASLAPRTAPVVSREPERERIADARSLSAKQPEPEVIAPSRESPVVAAEKSTSTSPPRAADVATIDATPTIVEQAPPRPLEPAARTFDELVVSADSVLGLQVETAVSSETARVEDAVEARVTRDVKVGDRVAIPSGARVLGSVMQVERGGKVKEPARLGVRFHTIVLGDGTRVSVTTDTVFRGGNSPAAGSAAKIGGAAIGGAILGAILGGGKGAAIGGSVGAAGGTAAVMAGQRNPAVLPAGAPVTVRILSPVTVTVER
jgi:hypothetical protein